MKRHFSADTDTLCPAGSAECKWALLPARAKLLEMLPKRDPLARRFVREELEQLERETEAMK